MLLPFFLQVAQQQAELQSSAWDAHLLEVRHSEPRMTQNAGQGRCPHPEADAKCPGQGTGLPMSLPPSFICCWGFNESKHTAFSQDLS